MVGDGGLDRPGGHQAALVDQPAQQLGVVDDLVVAAQVGYSRARVLKQWGQEAITLRAPTPLRVSMFCWAWSW